MFVVLFPVPIRFILFVLGLLFFAYPALISFLALMVVAAFIAKGIVRRNRHKAQAARLEAEQRRFNREFPWQKRW